MGEEELNLCEEMSTEICQQEEVFADISKGTPWGVEHSVEALLGGSVHPSCPWFCMYKYSIDWIVYNSKYISHSSGGYKSQVMVAADFVSTDNPLSGS